MASVLLAGGGEGGASGVAEGEEVFFGGGGGYGVGEVAAEEVVAGLVAVGPFLELGEVEGGCSLTRAGELLG
ncbi:hypothetical protein AB0L49_42370 [Streptomyces antimycoticus]|uniref:hypothetical protein n=1 Tax=Streptomyces TaxID=1883 RepID=UPI00342974AE